MITRLIALVVTLLNITAISPFASAFADTPVQPILSCKKPDFDSFKKARVNQEALIKNNPPSDQTNFANHYRLLTIEYAMETAWYLLDCETGKFVPEILLTDLPLKKAEFNVNSNLLKFNKGEGVGAMTEVQAFNDGKWAKVANQNTPTNLIGAENSSATASLYLQFPVRPEFIATDCKTPVFNSYDRAENNKKSILSMNPEISKPNFNGHYLVLKAESIFESYWLIADCKSGQFSKTILPGNAEFKKESRLLKIFNNGSFTRYYLWLENDEQWLQIRTAESPADAIKNTVFGRSARQLFDSIPNPDKKNVVRFENHKWIENSMIITGKCMNDTGSPRCDIEF